MVINNSKYDIYYKYNLIKANVSKAEYEEFLNRVKPTERDNIVIKEVRIIDDDSDWVR